MAPTVAALVLLSAVLHPLWNALIKRDEAIAAAYLSFTVVLAWIALIHLVAAGGVPWPKDAWGWLILGLSSAGQFVYGVALIITLKRGDLSLYYPVIRASPLFMVGLAVVFLGQRYAATVILGILLVIAGIAVLQKPRGRGLLADPVTLGWALLAMMASGVYALADAWLVRHIHPAALIFWTQVACVPGYWLVFRRTTGFRVPPRIWLGGEARHLLAGVMAYASYYLILLAFQLGGEAAAVTAVRQLAIPLSVIVGGTMLREAELKRRLIGALIVAMGVVLIIASR